MKKFMFLLSVCLLFSLCSCKTSDKEDYVVDEIYIVEAPQEQDIISLQNLKTREIVRCRATSSHTAEECAEMFENSGFVRFRDIPSQTAEYDALQTNTYPSRKWRKGEKNPRW